MTVMPACIVVTAVRAETRAVLDVLQRVRRTPTSSGVPGWEGEIGTRRIRVLQAGIGRERARCALAVSAPCPLVLCVGFAGGLVDEARPGDIVLPTEVFWDDGNEAGHYAVSQATWEAAHAALADTKRRMLRGPLWSSTIVVASPRDKRAAHERTGAVAVEMETAGLVPIARTWSASVLPLRTVLDTVDVSLEELPSDLDESWRARMQLVGRPRAWSSLWTLARQLPLATTRLREAVRSVLRAL